MQHDAQLRIHPSNLLEAMIAQADQPDSGLSDAQVAGNVLTMLLAGEDTTANTIAWMIYLLWTHPETLQQAKEEMEANVGDSHCPTMDVPRGTIVINLLRSDTLREDLVDQANEFRPERWLRAHNPAKRMSTPFGAGPRICPGRYLALLEMKIAMTVLLGQFDITYVGTADGSPPQERLSFAMMPVGLLMRLQGRGTSKPLFPNFVV